MNNGKLCRMNSNNEKNQIMITVIGAVIAITLTVT